MPTPFPGMDPYLEARGLWEEVHTGLIVGLQQFLAPRVRPRYRVAVERRTYLEMVSQPEIVPIGKPDVLITAAKTRVQTDARDEKKRFTMAEVPMPDEVVERFLEIRDPLTAEVITIIEVLSPSNKSDFTGRRQYEQKRLAILGSATHLVEIDLLRAGQPLPLRPRDPLGTLGTYRIVVSRSQTRPTVELRAFDLRDAIPSFPVPLRTDDTEPEVPLNEILHELYDRAGFDLAINYNSAPPAPRLTSDDKAWVTKLLARR